ncbi:hypothetical protein FS764_07700 [Agrobacterium vitis]|uniref:hypothetical protein n=1 Tax=Agrobacterium vitis TaxID=373 RepID=UPI001F3B69B0|nr:hypothetical protein [Agrobacterium vitis]MCF1466799.1 hypothetical protein [Agrobacterium vitis]
MGLEFHNLDEVTRDLMLDELTADVGASSIYISNYLNEKGAQNWPILLQEAMESGSDDSLADALRLTSSFKTRSERKNPKGGTILVSVPITAAQTLAESQFNMYYMRALARRSLSGEGSLFVYRAKQVENPRQTSEILIGKKLNANEVLAGLRSTKGVNPPDGIPLPNTGITVKLV